MEARQEDHRARQCTLYVHTMRDQAALDFDSKVEVIFDEMPGQVTTKMIKEEVLRKLNLTSDNAKKCFSIWITSPYLQLQLNLDHKPCLFYKKWEQLLVLYTDCNYDATKSDKPILSFQRNAFLKREDESIIGDADIIDLLYEEAKLNVLRGVYPMEVNDIVELAGMQAAIEETSSKTSPTALYYKDRLARYFPYYMVKKTRGVIFPKLKPPYVPSLEEQLMASHLEVLSRNIDDLKLEYLEKCRKESYYGSVFFSGQIQRKLFGYANSKLFGSFDRLISVAINTSGIHIIRKTKPELLLSLPFCEVSWHYEECKDTGDEFFSALILEFDDPNENSDEATQRLKIFSRQAPMMDNMIKRITDDLNYCEHRKTSGGDTDEVDFAEQPSIRQPSTAQPFKCKIVVDHMLLVCEEVLPDGTSKPVKSKRNRVLTGRNDIEMSPRAPTNQ